jgi:hypothetical protein
MTDKNREQPPQPGKGDSGKGDSGESQRKERPVTIPSRTGDSAPGENRASTVPRTGPKFPPPTKK